MWRSRPAAPASRSRSRPLVAPRTPSRAPTGTPSGISGADLPARLPAVGEFLRLQRDLVDGVGERAGQPDMPADRVQQMVATRVHGELADVGGALAGEDALGGDRPFLQDPI